MRECGLPPQECQFPRVRAARRTDACPRRALDIHDQRSAPAGEALHRRGEVGLSDARRWKSCRCGGFRPSSGGRRKRAAAGAPPRRLARPSFRAAALARGDRCSARRPASGFPLSCGGKRCGRDRGGLQRTRALPQAVFGGSRSIQPCAFLPGAADHVQKGSRARRRSLQASFFRRGDPARLWSCRREAIRPDVPRPTDRRCPQPRREFQFSGIRCNRGRAALRVARLSSRCVAAILSDRRHSAPH